MRGNNLYVLILGAWCLVFVSCTLQAPPDPTPRPVTLPIIDSLRVPGGAGLVVGADQQAAYQYTPAGYQLIVHPSDQLVWSLFAGAYTEASFTVQATRTTGDARSAAGLVFGYQSAASFYLFTVSWDGFYRLGRFVDGRWTILIDWTPLERIVPPVQGAPQQMTLRVVVRNKRAELFVNDVWLETAGDGGPLTGSAGLAALTTNSGTMVTTFTDLRIEAVTPT